METFDAAEAKRLADLRNGTDTIFGFVLESIESLSKAGRYFLSHDYMPNVTMITYQEVTKRLRNLGFKVVVNSDRLSITWNQL